jgi:hypothetical protein
MYSLTRLSYACGRISLLASHYSQASKYLTSLSIMLRLLDTRLMLMIYMHRCVYYVQVVGLAEA